MIRRIRQAWRLMLARVVTWQGDRLQREMERAFVREYQRQHPAHRMALTVIDGGRTD